MVNYLLAHYFLITSIIPLFFFYLPFTSFILQKYIFLFIKIQLFFWIASLIKPIFSTVFSPYWFWILFNLFFVYLCKLNTAFIFFLLFHILLISVLLVFAIILCLLLLPLYLIFYVLVWCSDYLVFPFQYTFLPFTSVTKSISHDFNNWSNLPLFDFLSHFCLTILMVLDIFYVFSFYIIHCISIGS